MTRQRLSLGAWGEDQAARFLRRRGIKILERNFRTPVGEIDIIARDRDWLIFAEVKTRRSAVFGLPQDAVGPRKQRQIIRTAQWYLQRSRSGRLQPRFDVLGVLRCADGSAQVTHLPGAFAVPDS